jgi:hypothetical protein
MASDKAPMASMLERHQCCERLAARRPDNEARHESPVAMRGTTDRREYMMPCSEGQHL